MDTLNMLLGITAFLFLICGIWMCAVSAGSVDDSRSMRASMTAIAMFMGMIAIKYLIAPA